MENIEGLSKEELREYILEQMRDMGIDPETIEIGIEDGPKIILRGKVDSVSERKMVKQTIMDLTDINDIVDELVVISGVVDDLEDEKLMEEAELHDEDDESLGTEDTFQSIEDGIPYIPPSAPTYRESPENIKWKKKKKKEQ
ncbi:MAG: hypothetical protein U9R44_02295 [Candidatus Omnitrophota bacterium]|nr:hypothetical protein [Candidatus Omnitrophota bacterium]